MKHEYRVGDVHGRVAEIPARSIDCIVCSPPFVKLRGYLPVDHPAKHKEIGQELTPAEYLDTLLELTDEFARVLAPHASLCVELGDTYAGSGGAGGDYSPGGMRAGQETFAGSASNRGEGWPLDKSKAMIDTLYPASLAYGRNLLTGRTVDQWLIRNRIAWVRTNPTPGRLGDKFRPATSYITVACKGNRWFDLEAVRNGGGPPLDWHSDLPPEDGDWLWCLPTQPYHGAHHAVFPLELPKRLILAMCPIRVCRACNTPSERTTEKDTATEARLSRPVKSKASTRAQRAGRATVQAATGRHVDHTVNITTGWTTCGCKGTDGLRLDGYHTGQGWRPGVVLDPFAGSGTTIAAALLTGRSAIGIDIDERNADLAQERVGMFLETDIPPAVTTTTDIPEWTAEPVAHLQEVAAQEALFAS